MKNNLLIALLCLAVNAVFAQPIITNADLLKVGDMVITQPCNTEVFNPGGAGADQIWDFSQLVPEGPEDTTFYISPVGTPYEANYPSSNIVAKFGEAEYDYYQVANDQLLYLGYQEPTGSLLLTDPAVYFQSPTTFGTFLIDSIAGTLSAAPLQGSVVGHVYFSGDGYGTLQTPGSQFEDVLRVKTVTIAVATVPIFGNIIDSVFNYSWYKLGVKSPVLEMIDDTQWAGGAVLSQTRYVNYFRSITSGATEPGETKGPLIQVFPNPTDDQIQFSRLEKSARVIIQNTAGQRVMDKTIDPSDHISLKNLGTGLYICSIYLQDGSTQTGETNCPVTNSPITNIHPCFATS